MLTDELSEKYFTPDYEAYAKEYIKATAKYAPASFDFARWAYFEKISVSFLPRHESMVDILIVFSSMSR